MKAIIHAIGLGMLAIGAYHVVQLAERIVARLP